MKEPIKLSVEANRGRVESYLKNRLIYDVLPSKELNTIDKLYNAALSTLGGKRNILTYNELVSYLMKKCTYIALDKDKIISLLKEAISCNNEAIKYWNVVEFEESDDELVEFYYYANARIITTERFDGERKKTAQAIYNLLINDDIESIEVYGLPGYNSRVAEAFKPTQGELLQLCKDLLFSYTASLTWLPGALRVNSREWNEALFRQDITGEKKQNCKAPNEAIISIEFNRRKSFNNGIYAN